MYTGPMHRAFHKTSKLYIGRAIMIIF